MRAIVTMSCALALLSVAIGETGRLTEDGSSTRQKIADTLARRLAGEPAEEGDDMKSVLGNPRDALEILESYFADERDDARDDAYRLYGIIAVAQTDPGVRQASVSRLVRELALEGEGPEREDTHYFVLARQLLDFSSSDFSEKDRTTILRILEQAAAHPDWSDGARRMAILLAGVACIEEAKPLLAQFIEEEKPKRGPATMSGHAWMSSLTWNAMRASARIYRSEDIQRCIDFVDSKGSTAYQKVTGWSDQLSYIRQPEVVEYLLPFLEQDEMKVFPGSELPESIAGRATGILWPMFPDLDAELRAWRETTEVQSGRRVTHEEHWAFIRAWFANRENWKKMYR